MEPATATLALLRAVEHLRGTQMASATCQPLDHHIIPVTAAACHAWQPDERPAMMCSHNTIALYRISHYYNAFAQTRMACYDKTQHCSIVPKQ